MRAILGVLYSLASTKFSSVLRLPPDICLCRLFPEDGVPVATLALDFFAGSLDSVADFLFLDRTGISTACNRDDRRTGLCSTTTVGFCILSAGSETGSGEKKSVALRRFAGIPIQVASRESGTTRKFWHVQALTLTQSEDHENCGKSCPGSDKSNISKMVCHIN
jgi:hypothetical protein